MSVHSSLRSSRQKKGHRNVLKRFERLEYLKGQKRWTDEASIFSLPKVRSIKLRKKKSASKAAADTDKATKDNK